MGAREQRESGVDLTASVGAFDSTWTITCWWRRSCMHARR